jgi:hypothetical protein
MNHSEIDFMIMQARRRDELAAAEHSRLVEIALQARNENRTLRNDLNPDTVFRLALHLAGQVIYQLGLRIESWGCQLQVRYATTGGRAAPCD